MGRQLRPERTVNDEATISTQPASAELQILLGFSWGFNQQIFHLDCDKGGILQSDAGGGDHNDEFRPSRRWAAACCRNALWWREISCSC